MQYNDNWITAFHGLEIREAYYVLSKLSTPEEAQEQLIKLLTGGIWKEYLEPFLSSDYTKDELLDLRIAYYLASGCGIMRIIKLLKTSQTRVYRVRNEMQHPRPQHELQPMFNLEPQLATHIHEVLSYLNVLDGFRFSTPSNPHDYIEGQVRKT